MNLNWKIADDLNSKCYHEDEAKSVCTPIALATEMVGKIPAVTGIALVISDLGLLDAYLVRLNRQAIPFSRTIFAAHTQDQVDACREYQDRGLTVMDIGYNDSALELKKKITDMKFDIVIGNPPYSLDRDSGQKNREPIYQHFYNVCYRHLAHGGRIVWIQPDTWRKAYFRDYSFKEMRKSLCSGEVVKITTAVKPWDTVSVVVDWFMVEKGRTGTTIVNNSVATITSIDDYKLAPSFLHKILSVADNGTIINRGTYPPTAGENPIAVKTKDKNHTFPVACAGHLSIDDVACWSSKPLLGYGTSKVIVSLIRALRPMPDMDGIISLGSDSAACPVSNAEEAEFLVKLLNSDPIQAVLAYYGDSPYTRKGMNAGKRNRGAEWLSKIKIDYAFWNIQDSNFYQYFGLDEHDILSIETLLNGT